MTMLIEWNDEQRKRAVDTRQVYGAWQESWDICQHTYRGSMHWRTVKGREYLYHIINQSSSSLGPRSERTEAILASHQEGRTKWRARLAKQNLQLKQMAKVTRALNLGRVPLIAARILRRLNQKGLLGRQLFVVGTHALYAYEAAAGVFLSNALTATSDIDLMLDSRRKISLALTDVQATGVIGLLRRVDSSFTAPKNSFRATNDDGYDVDLIKPYDRNEILAPPRKVGTSDEDLIATALNGMQWLINAPKFSQIVIGSDGLPTTIHCVDPRVFALHKLWLARQGDRDPVKKRRDAAQGKAAATIAVDYLGLSFNDHKLSALPQEMLKLLTIV